MEEPGDEFFEVTQEDLHRMMGGANRGRAAETQGLRTAKMREQESQQRAARLGPVPIRLQLPDGLTVQVRPLHAFERIEFDTTFVSLRQMRSTLLAAAACRRIWSLNM